MKAVAVFPKTHEVKVIELPAPRVGSPSQVLVRTLEVGVCGTDREVVQGKHGRPPEGEDHLVVGHECLGEVVEVGEGVRELRPGDLVVPRVRRPCPSADCGPCRAGHPDFCVTGLYTERGIQGAHGFCAEFFVEEAQALHPVPRGLRDVAVLTEPLTIAEKSLREVVSIQRRLPAPLASPRRAVVLGAGPVGLLGAMALLRSGFETTVYSYASTPNSKADLTQKLGAPYLSSKDFRVEQLVERHGRADLVYEAAGVASAVFALLPALATNGVFILTGVPGSQEETLDEGGLMKQLVLNNQVILGTVNAAPEDFTEAISDLERFRTRWPGVLETLITARHGPEDYARLVGSPGSGIKDIIVFAPDSISHPPGGR